LRARVISYIIYAISRHSSIGVNILTWQVINPCALKPSIHLRVKLPNEVTPRYCSTKRIRIPEPVTRMRSPIYNLTSRDLTKDLI